MPEKKKAPVKKAAPKAPAAKKVVTKVIYVQAPPQAQQVDNQGHPIRNGVIAGIAGYELANMFMPREEIIYDYNYSGGKKKAPAKKSTKSKTKGKK